MPSNTVTIMCVDGLSPLDVLQIKSIYNFGGKFKFDNCNVGHENAVLKKTFDSIRDLYIKSDQKKNKS